MPTSATSASSPLSASRASKRRRERWQAEQTGRFRRLRRGLGDEAHGDHLDPVAAALVEADRAADQGGDARQLLRRALAPGGAASPGRSRRRHPPAPRPRGAAPPGARAPCCGWSGRSRSWWSPPAGSLGCAEPPACRLVAARQVAGDRGRRRLGAAVLLVHALLGARHLVLRVEALLAWSAPGRSPSRPSPRRGPGRGRGCAPAAPRRSGRCASPAPAASPPATAWRAGRRRAGQRLAAARQQLAPAVHDGDAAAASGPARRWRPGAAPPARPSRSSRWAPCMASTTLACASPRSREKASRRGSTRWTRAVRTPERPRMVRASSPSRARSRFTSCWKGVVVRLSARSKISQPTPPPAGRPSRARVSRSRGTWSTGARMLGAARLQPVGHALPLQRGDHRARVPRLHLAEEGRHGRVAGAHRQGGEQRQQRQPHPAQGGEPLRPERLQPGHHAAHRATSCGNTRDCIPNPSRRPALRRCGKICPGGLAQWLRRRRETVPMDTPALGLISRAGARKGRRQDEDRRMKIVACNSNRPLAEAVASVARPPPDQRLHPPLRRPGDLRGDPREHPRRGRLRGAVHQLSRPTTT